MIFNFDYKRYNYRANLDFDISKTTLLSVNIGGRVESKRTPESGEDQNQLFRKLYWAVPFASAGIVDGKYIKTNADYVTKPGADGLESYYGKGFRNQTTNVLNLDLVLDQKLDFITKGLSIKLKGSYNSSYSTTKIASSCRLCPRRRWQELQPPKEVNSVERETAGGTCCGCVDYKKRATGRP